MSGGGGKGGSSTTATQIPDWVRQPAERNLARAEEISQIGYVPHSGPEVAAFTPQQMGAFNNANSAADAYGMQGGQFGMAAPETFANGMQGYSSMPLYNAAVDDLAANRPGQYNAIMNQFIDPVTGVSPVSQAAATTAQNALTDDAAFNLSQMGDAQGYNDGPSGSIGFGGYTGVGDAFDGGGPGQSGGSFQGGGAVSAVGNAFGGPSGGSGSGGGNK